jgi:hypothetical protein
MAKAPEGIDTNDVAVHLKPVDRGKETMKKTSE